MDIAKELFDFLWKSPHREGRGIAAGNGTDHIFLIKESDAEKFEKLYMKASRTGYGDINNDELPFESVTRSENGAIWNNGAYIRNYPGYNFDGFYESGPKVNIDCQKYLTFRRILWYYDRFLRRLFSANPQPSLNESYVVCIMKDDYEKDKSK